MATSYKASTTVAVSTASPPRSNNLKRPNCQESSSSSKRKCTSSSSETYELSDICGIGKVGLNKRIEECHLPILAPHFDNPNAYAELGFNLARATKGDVRKCAFDDNRLAMFKALKGWLDMNPLQATFRQLIEIILRIENDENDIHDLLTVIKTLRVKCNNQKEHCQWEGPLEELETHIQTCDYSKVPCPNECKAPSYEVRKIVRRDFFDHLNNECPKRKHRCKYCREVGEYMIITTSRLQICTRVCIPCPNYPCAQKIRRNEIQNHQSVCDYEPVSCKYAEVGCKERPLRKDLKKHVEDDQFHIRITTKKVLELDRILKKCE